MSSQSPAPFLGMLGHKIRSFLKFLGRDPKSAVRRLRGYFRPPLFLFQMGKVGSSTHKNTLQTLYHVHHLHTAGEFRGKFRPLASRGTFDLITIIREPLGRKISTFFQNLVNSPYAYSFDSQEAAQQAGIDELLRRFHSWNDGVTEATHWFDNHFEPATGIRIYEQGFDFRIGWQIFEDGIWRVLVLRFEDIRTNHLEALNEFVASRFGDKIHFDSLLNSNVSSRKWYSGLMKEFRGRLRFSDVEISKAYDSPYCRYFYSPEEIDRMRSGWIAADFTG